MGSICLTYSSRHIPANFYPRLALKGDPTVMHTLCITTAVVRHFVNEMAEFVVTQTKAELKDIFDRDPQIDTLALHAQRRKALTRWSQLTRPFEGTATATQDLLYAIYPAPAKGGYELLKSDQSLTQQGLVELFYEVATGALKPTSPLLAKGAAASLLVKAFHLTTQLSGNDGKEAVIKERFCSSLLLAFQDQKVERLPGAQKTKPRAPNHHFWIPLKISPEQPQLLVERLEAGAQPQLHPEHEAECRRRETWSTAEVQLNDVGDYIHHVNAPSDLNIQFAHITPNANNEYVIQTFEYILARFSMENPVHHLVLFKAIIFSKLIKWLRHDKNPSSAIFKSKRDAGQDWVLSDFIRCSGWLLSGELRNGAVKGFTDPSPFVVLVTVYTLALLDENSPLRKRMAIHNGAVGAAWTDKYSECFLPHRQAMRIAELEP
jgi:hypothetical protein